MTFCRCIRKRWRHCTFWATLSCVRLRVCKIGGLFLWEPRTQLCRIQSLTAGLKVRGLGGLSPPAFSSAPPPAQGELGDRLREGLRERGKRWEGAPQLFHTTLSTDWHNSSVGFSHASEPGDLIPRRPKAVVIFKKHILVKSCLLNYWHVF